MNEFSVAVNSSIITAITQIQSSSQNQAPIQDEPLIPGSPFSNLEIFLSPTDSGANLKCFLVAEMLKVKLSTGTGPAPIRPRLPILIAYRGDRQTVIFGANSVCKYIAANLDPCFGVGTTALEGILEFEELELSPLLKASTCDKVRLTSALDTLEAYASNLSTLPLARTMLYPTLTKAFEQVKSGPFKGLTKSMEGITGSPTLVAATSAIAQFRKSSPLVAVASAPSSSSVASDRGLSSAEVALDWGSAGLLSSLRLIFTTAIQTAFPQAVKLEQDGAIITRCGNAAHGDFQCNNAMGLHKALKQAGFEVPRSPRELAETIAGNIPRNPLVASTSVAPNGFINIVLSTATMVQTLATVVQRGVMPPSMPKQKILVDFSSPNIAKEMHVGHLRSTIIGDSICRILEYCGHEVARINHVGDWGTQFGMLITYLQDEYPTILTEPPNITDLTAIYKASKARFDADPVFKERARQNVVRLQGGDAACRAIWNLLCDISRAEFQKVYDMLDVALTEVGESFYNPLIPAAIEELQQCGLVQNEEGMLVIKLDHFDIPLIVRKSDGGYGYDSTDMAAVSYRLRTLKNDWVIYITDAGQASHFHMCFDAAKAAGWVPTQKLSHIGFGVVCGDDGKRFRTRASETVRLVDLLDAAKDRMAGELQQRADEGKTPLRGEDLQAAAKVIGYGAVKYFDLKQHPSSNYIFSYDRMLDTKGDTAVYLLFAYARVASILRKAREERGIDVEGLFQDATAIITLDHPAERTLAFELLQFGDVIKGTLSELGANRLCDLLKEIAVKFTDFVTKCHVLNSPETQSRLLLCEATRRVLAKCFELLGIGTLERI